MYVHIYVYIPLFPFGEYSQRQTVISVYLYGTCTCTTAIYFGANLCCENRLAHVYESLCKL